MEYPLACRGGVVIPARFMRQRVARSTHRQIFLFK